MPRVHTTGWALNRRRRMEIVSRFLSEVLREGLPARPLPTVRSETSANQPTVLLVDDETMVRLWLKTFLTENGIRTLEAASGDEARRILEAGLVRIDLVFTDCRMPGATDGFALARWVRENRPGMAVIVASGDRKNLAKDRKLSASGAFFEKPYRPDLVLAHIRRLLAAAAYQAAARSRNALTG